MEYLLFAAQLVYMHIFRQPLLFAAAATGGKDALTNYWREALEGILAALPILILLMIPPIVIGIVLHKKKWEFPSAALLPMQDRAPVREQAPA